MSTDKELQASIASDPDSMINLTRAGALFANKQYKLAEPLFRAISKQHPQYHIAVSALFTILWEKSDTHSRDEAQLLLDEFLEEADRSDPEIKPAVANFIKIKIGLLQSNEWTRDT